jgi:hypothetical protein
MGYDISWPQCDEGYPAIAGGAIAIVGVNDGRPNTMNPCFGSEFQWAEQSAGMTGIYLYMGYGQSLDGAGPCQVGDRTCLAYNYGWVTAEYAYVQALADTNGASETVPIWWLDVEVDSNWDSNPVLNSRALQGAIDYLQGVQDVQVGVYSVGDMWQQIVGGYAPPYVYNWIAGGADRNDFGTCAGALWPNAAVLIFQTWETGAEYDIDRGC